MFNLELNLKENKLALDEFIEKLFFYYDLAGLAVGIGDKDGLKYTSFSGHKNIEKNEAIDKNTIFHCASLTKLFVGTTFNILARDEMLSLDDLLTLHLPWFYMEGDEYKKITIRHLLTHTSGMPDCEDYEWDKPRTDEAALTDYVKSICGKSLLWSPDENKFAYSNIGYEILGCIIAKVSGESFEECVKLEVFLPFDMRDSELLTFNRDLLDICVPYYKNEDGNFCSFEHFPYNRAHAPSSTLTSNISDLSKFAQYWVDVCDVPGAPPQMENPKLPVGCDVPGAPPQPIQFIPHAEVPNNGEHIGLSWFIRKQNGYTLYGHEGNDDGFRSSFWLSPSANLYIIVLSNTNGAPVKKINKQIFDLICP